jgi:hypothetical protein
VEHHFSVLLRLRRHIDHHLAALGELDGVADQVHDDLAQASRIADHPLRHRQGDVGNELQLLLGGLNGEGLQRVAQGLAQLERQLLELEPPRLDLREVEDVVQQPQQGVRRALRHRQVLALLRIQRRAQQQVGHADHAVHRRPDLVAHVREEVALGHVGLLGRFLGHAQLAFGTLEVVGAGLDALFELVARALQRGVASLDLTEHVVERIGQDTELVLAQLGGTQRVVLVVGDRVGHPRELAHRAAQHAPEPRGGPRRESQGDEQHEPRDAEVAAAPGRDVVEIALDVDEPELLLVERDRARDLGAPRSEAHTFGPRLRGEGRFVASGAVDVCGLAGRPVIFGEERALLVVDRGSHHVGVVRQHREALCGRLPVVEGDRCARAGGQVLRGGDELRLDAASHPQLVVGHEARDREQQGQPRRGHRVQTHLGAEVEPVPEPHASPSPGERTIFTPRFRPSSFELRRSRALWTAARSMCMLTRLSAASNTNSIMPSAREKPSMSLTVTIERSSSCCRSSGQWLAWVRGTKTR